MSIFRTFGQEVESLDIRDLPGYSDLTEEARIKVNAVYEQTMNARRNMGMKLAQGAALATAKAMVEQLLKEMKCPYCNAERNTTQGLMAHIKDCPRKGMHEDDSGSIQHADVVKKNAEEEPMNPTKNIAWSATSPNFPPGTPGGPMTPQTSPDNQGAKQIQQLNWKAKGFGPPEFSKEGLPEALITRKRELSIPDKHLLKISRDTLKMHPAMARVMGGPSHEEARAHIKRLTGKTVKEGEVDESSWGEPEEHEPGVTYGSSSESETPRTTMTEDEYQIFENDVTDAIRTAKKNNYSLQGEPKVSHLGTSFNLKHPAGHSLRLHINPEHGFGWSHTHASGKRESGSDPHSMVSHLHGLDEAVRAPKNSRMHDTITGHGFEYKGKVGGFRTYRKGNDVIKHKYPTTNGNHSFAHVNAQTGQPVWKNSNTGDTEIHQHLNKHFPMSEAYLGFKKLENKLSHKKGIYDPAGLAAAIGRKKYGSKGFSTHKHGEVEEAELGFKKLEGELAHRKGVRDPGAVAAAIGRKKYGSKGFSTHKHVHEDEVDKHGNPNTVIDPNHPSYEAGYRFATGKMRMGHHDTHGINSLSNRTHRAAVAHASDTDTRQSTLANKLHMQRQFKAGAHAAQGMTEASSKEIQNRNFEEKCDYCNKVHAVGPCPNVPAMDESEWKVDSPAYDMKKVYPGYEPDNKVPYEEGGDWGKGPFAGGSKGLLNKNHAEKGEPVEECGPIGDMEESSWGEPEEHEPGVTYGSSSESEIHEDDWADKVRAGDRITIRQHAGLGRNGPEYKEATGRAVMRGPHGWALNMGGKHGTPGVATSSNFVKHHPSKLKEETVLERDHSICFCGHEAGSHTPNGCRSCKREGHVTPSMAQHKFKLNSSVRMESVQKVNESMKETDMMNHAMKHGFTHGGSEMDGKNVKRTTMNHPSGHRLEILTFHHDPKSINHHLAGEGTWGLHNKSSIISSGHDPRHLEHELGKVSSGVNENIDPILQASVDWLAKRVNVRGITEAAMPKPELRERDKFGNHSVSLNEEILIEETHETQDPSHKRTTYHKTLTDSGYAYHHTDQGEHGKWHHYENPKGDTARTFHHEGGHHAYHLKKKGENRNWMEGSSRLAHEKLRVAAALLDEGIRAKKTDPHPLHSTALNHGYEHKGPGTTTKSSTGDVIRHEYQHPKTGHRLTLGTVQKDGGQHFWQHEKKAADERFMGYRHHGITSHIEPKKLKYSLGRELSGKGK